MTCEALDLEVTESLKNVFIASQNSRNDVKTFYVHQQSTKYFPNNVGFLFPDLVYVFNELSQLKFIEKKHFMNMDKVVELSLARNAIESIPADAFDHLRNVEIIYLHINRLKQLSANLFIKNSNLREIFVYRNQLETLPNGLFRNNHGIVGLHFDHNKLRKIGIHFDPSRSYERINFNGNVCTNIIFPDNSGQTELILEIQKNC